MPGAGLREAESRGQGPRRGAAPCCAVRLVGVPYSPSSLHPFSHHLLCPVTPNSGSSVHALAFVVGAPTYPQSQPLPISRLIRLPAPPRPMHQGVYRAFSSNAKFVNAASLPLINFMGAAVIEMYGINPSEWTAGQSVPLECASGAVVVGGKNACPGRSTSWPCMHAMHSHPHLRLST